MKANLRSRTENDYPMLCKWWEAHGWEPVLEAVLPKIGVIAEVNDEQVAAAFLYMDNSSPLAIIEWIVSNPESKPRDVVSSIIDIVNFLADEAKRFDYSFILTSCSITSLAKLLERRCSFKITDKSVYHLGRVI